MVSRPKIILPLFLLFFPVLSFSQLSDEQQTQIDSLKEVIETAKHDTVVVKAWDSWAAIIKPADLESELNLQQKIINKCQEWLSKPDGRLNESEKRIYQARLGFSYYRLGDFNMEQENFHEAVEYFQKSLEMSEAAGNKEGVGGSLYYIGLVYDRWGEFDKSREYYLKSLKINEELDNKEGIAALLNNLALIHNDQGEYEEGLTYYERSIELYKETNARSALASAFNNVGLLYINLGNYSKALDYFNQSLKVNEELGNKLGIAVSLSSVGTVYYYQDQLSNALDYFSRSLKIREEIGHQSGIVNSLNNIGSIYKRQGDYDNAMKQYVKCLKIHQELGDKRKIALTLLNISTIHRNQGDLSKALRQQAQSLLIYEQLGDKSGMASSYTNLSILFFDKNNYPKAIEYGEKAFDLAKEIGNTENIKIATETLYKAYKHKNRDSEALEMYEAYIVARDSLDGQANQKATLHFEYERKALADSVAYVKERAVTEAAYQAQTTQRNYLILAGLALLTIAFIIFRYRQQLRNTEKENELKHERERREQLLELNNLKSRFFANISHELRTPLTLILGPLSHILDQPNAWEQASVQEQLTVMQRNGKSLMHLIEEILALSKLEAHQLELEEERTDLKIFTAHIFSAYKIQFQNQNISHSLEIETQDNLPVLLDRGKMEKVLNNYLSNALKFTPQGGTICLSITESKDNLQFKVTDTGKGIHPEDLSHVFDRFYQSKHGDNIQQGGTGIGLGLVKEIAHLMEGRVYAESDLGKGSSFYFEIPKKVASTPEIQILNSDVAAELEPIHSIGTDFTIMVVEDNADMRDFIHRLLKPKYAKILLAQNGAEGLDLLQKHGKDIHLIVSDIMMPEVDGLSLLKAVKSHDDWQHIPVIMLTALAAERDKLTALTIGVDDYLTKPFSVHELTTRIQNLLYNAHQRKTWIESDEFQKVSEAKEIETELSPADKEWIVKLEGLVEVSLPKERLTVEALADAAHLSPRQLQRKIKTLTGFSPRKFIKEVQLQLVRRELEDGKVISLSDVAFKFGFEHHGTFSTVFKARYGKSPSEYLKSQLKEA